jgi:hypothetical protein
VEISLGKPLLRRQKEGFICMAICKKLGDKITVGVDHEVARKVSGSLHRTIDTFRNSIGDAVNAQADARRQRITEVARGV